MDENVQSTSIPFHELSSREEYAHNVARQEYATFYPQHTYPAVHSKDSLEDLV